MKKNGVSLVEFVQEDRFELSSYITSLFNKLNDYVPKSLKDKRWVTIKNGSGRYAKLPDPFFILFLGIRVLSSALK